MHDSKIKTIGVVADTHIPTRGRYIPPTLFKAFAGVDLILHAGDLVEKSVLDELRILAPVEAVAGNMDPQSLHKSLGRIKLVKTGNVAIGLLHGDLAGRQVSFSNVKNIFDPETISALVFGHLHEAVVREENGILFFNPGSAVDPRRAPQPSCGLLEIEGRAISGKIVYL